MVFTSSSGQYGIKKINISIPNVYNRPSLNFGFHNSSVWPLLCNFLWLQLCISPFTTLSSLIPLGSDLAFLMERPMILCRRPPTTNPGRSAEQDTKLWRTGESNPTQSNIQGLNMAQYLQLYHKAIHDLQSLFLSNRYDTFLSQSLRRNKAFYRQ